MIHRMIRRMICRMIRRLHEKEGTGGRAAGSCETIESYMVLHVVHPNVYMYLVRLFTSSSPRGSMLIHYKRFDERTSCTSS